MIQTCFPSLIYQKRCAPLATPMFLRRFLDEVNVLQVEDRAGARWSRENYWGGYTSYGSVSDLHRRSPTFERLATEVERAAARYARALHWDLEGKGLRVSTLWANVMGTGTHHSFHLHPHSVVSGTFYVDVPKGSGSITFEDPRLSQFMAAPSRSHSAPARMKSHYRVQPRAGDLVLFESWMKHEVPANTASRPRVSVSFNLSWSE